jgi:hypothetical protein
MTQEQLLSNLKVSTLSARQTFLRDTRDKKTTDRVVKKINR